MSVRVQHLNYRPRLLARWVQPVAKTAAHNLTPCLLLLNVAADCGICDCACGSHVIRPRPQRRQLGTQMCKLLPQHTRRVALELVRKKLRCVRRIARHEQMYMIGHAFQALDLDIERRRLFVQQLLQACFNRARQNWLPIFWTPDEVQVQVVHTPRVFAIPLRTYVLYCSTVLDTCRLSNNERRKANSPAA